MLARTLGLTLLMALNSSVQAGAILETVNRELSKKQESTTVTYAQDGYLRIEAEGPQGNFAIFKNDIIYSVEPRQKTYTVIDRATMQRMAQQLAPALKRMEEMMAKMTPEQRAQMEKMMGNRMSNGGPPVVEEVRKTKRTDKVAGHNCTYTELVKDGVVSMEACVTPPAALQGSQEIYDASLKVAALMKEMTAGLDAPFIRSMTDRQIENYSRLGGIPLRTRRFSDGQPRFETVMKSLRSETLAASLFEVPSGYTQKELPIGR